MNTSQEQDIQDITENDYIILCSQRSGSHLLATLLNSHVDIRCFGEANERMSELIGTPKKLNGKIIMYNRANEDNLKGKIIHLIRDPNDTARSRFVNSQKLYEPHHREDVKLEAFINEEQINILAKEIKVTQDNFRMKIKDLPHIEVNYDLITNGENINTLEMSKAKKLLCFLEADYQTLTTNLKKPIWNFKNIKKGARITG